MKILKILIGILVVALLLQVFFGTLWYYTYSGLLFVFFIREFVVNLGRKIVFLEFLSALALLQWLIGPTLYYLYLEESLFYAFRMMVEPKEYFQFVYPATVALIAGLYLPLRKYQEDHTQLFESIKDYLSDKPKTGLILVATGLTSSFLSPYVPNSLSFIFFLLKDLMYVGAIYLFFSPFRGKVLTLGVVGVLLLFQTVKLGMFKEFVFWLLFFVIFLTFYYQISLRRKMVLSILVASLVGIIQSVKGEYRLATWESYDARQSKTSIMWGLIKNNIANPNSVFFNKYFLEQNVHRINQGALISHVMAHTPEQEPFARGATVKSAIFSSVLPRFLWPNKRKADEELFEKYSGIQLLRGTSMNLSPLGEAYANFGKLGSVIFMFFYGLFIGWGFLKFLQYAKGIPTVVLWLPMVFYQVLAVESDLFKVFNALTKGAIMVIFVFFVFRKILKTHI